MKQIRLSCRNHFLQSRTQLHQPCNLRLGLRSVFIKSTKYLWHIYGIKFNAGFVSLDSYMVVPINCAWY